MRTLYFLSGSGVIAVTLKVLSATFALLLFTAAGIYAQSGGIAVSGRVLDGTDKDSAQPLAGVTVGFPDYSTFTVTDRDGKFTLRDIPAGPARVTTSLLRYVARDTTVMVADGMELTLTMLRENFRMEQVIVTATANRAGQGTSSLVSRTAMDHLQATNIGNVMSLLPGAMSKNPSMSSAEYITLRGAHSTNANFSDATRLNALGVSVIQDGAPISNNANMSAMNPTVAGAITSLGGVASPAAGIDARNISADNIESIEIIRGVTSVEYGDLMTGAVIINSKAGREPLRVRAQLNPNVYGFSMGAGHRLGGERGALNYSAGYSHNTNDIRQSNRFYERANAKLLYSNSFFDNRWRANFSFDYVFSRDVRRQHPDDEVYMLATYGQRQSYKLNANGTVFINQGWLRNIQYVASGSYTPSKNFHQEQYTNAIATYSLTTTDGTILGNRPGEHLYDSDGNVITEFSGEDNLNYASKLPYTYVGRYKIDSREVNAFAKVKATLVKNIGNINNRIVIGADFKTDGNEGAGKTFDAGDPPYRNQSAPFSSFRQRNYSEIPYITQLGAFAEENFIWRMGRRALRIQAGIRYDNVSVAGDLWSPRINASFDVIPGTFTVRGGYGIEGKMPTLLYLYPEYAYFEYTNLDNLAQNLPDDEKYLVTTTRVFDPQNSELEIAYTTKAELGFDLRYNQYSLAVTAYRNSTENGYSMGYNDGSFHFSPFNNYVYNTVTQQIDFVDTRNILLRNARPTNDVAFETKGVEFILNLGRFHAIRTAFVIDGEWKSTRAYSSGYEYRYLTSAIADYHVGIFAPGFEQSFSEKFQTNFRITHNIPRIGFVVTLTVEALWRDAFWNEYHATNAYVPVMYISKNDGKVYDFPEDYSSDPDLAVLVYGQDYYDNSMIKQEYRPMVNFNINVTKEIGDWMRISFFANNVIRYYQLAENRRNQNQYVKRNKSYFFGLEMGLIF